MWTPAHASRRAGAIVLLTLLLGAAACADAPATPTLVPTVSVPSPLPPTATVPAGTQPTLTVTVPSPTVPRVAPTDTASGAATATAIEIRLPTPTPLEIRLPSPGATATEPPTPSAGPGAEDTPTDTPPALGVLTATAVPGSPAPTAAPATTSTLLLAALAAMAQVQTYHYTATVQTHDNGRTLQAASEGDFVAPDRLRWATATGGLTTTAIISGSLYYVSIGPAEWTLLPNPGPERARQQLWSLIAEARDVVEVGRDPATDPDPTVHLAFSLPFAALPLESHPWRLAQGDVWLGLADHRVRAFKLVAQEPLYDTTLRFYLSAFDAPVTITLPPPTTGMSDLQGRLLYSHFDAVGSSTGDLRVRELESGADAPLRGAQGPASGARWGPDGFQVIYSTVNDILYLLDPETEDLTNLGRGGAPAWSPDGATLAFVRGAGRATRAWAADPRVMAPVRLGDYFVQQLDWAPDGASLVFSGWRPTADPESAAPQLFTMDADGKNVAALPTVVGGASWPRWSPDGSQLAFVAGTHLALAAADGSDLTVLDPTGLDSAPVWSPDGTQIIYAHQPGRVAPRSLRIRPQAGGPAQDLTAGDDLPLDWR